MKTYTTTLETLQHDVGAILDEKLKATSPQAVADYVALGLDNLEANVKRAKEAKKELDAYIKNQQSAIDTIKQDTAEWLANTGIDKLEGMIISSITTYQPEPKVKLVIHDKYCEFLQNPDFMKTSLDETAVKNFLLNTDIDYSEFAELEKEYKQPQIKINKRKA